MAADRGVKRESKRQARHRADKTMWRIGSAMSAWLKAGCPDPPHPAWKKACKEFLDAGVIEKGPDGKDVVSKTWAHRREVKP